MAIKIRDLKFNYQSDEADIIKDFDLDIEEGEVVAVLGASGSGKSTLLRLISGLEVPMDGSIKIDDKLVTGVDTFIEPEQRGIGMVFQDYALFPHMTVEKNIMYGLKRMSKVDKLIRANEVLDLVNLSHINKRYPYELSGGQQQRVALARALAPKPKLLLLDEPFSNLDAHLKARIRTELRLIFKEANTTTIFVTHDKADANVLSDKIVYLNEGKIVNVIHIR